MRERKQKTASVSYMCYKYRSTRGFRGWKHPCLYILEKVCLGTSFSRHDGLALVSYQSESPTATLVWPSSSIHRTFHSLRTSVQTSPSF